MAEDTKAFQEEAHPVTMVETRRSQTKQAVFRVGVSKDKATMEPSTMEPPVVINTRQPVMDDSCSQD